MIRFLLLFLASFSVAANAALNAPDFNFVHYTTENGMPSNIVRDIAQDDDGFIWFATDGGLVRFDGTRFRVFMPGDAEQPDPFVLSLCNTPSGLFAGTDHRLYRYDPVMERLSPSPLSYTPGITEKIDGPVEDITYDSEGNIWVSVGRKGVFRISSDNMVTESHRFPEVDNFIGSVYVDQAGSIWAVSSVNGGGIFHYNAPRHTFEPYHISIGGKTQTLGSYAMLEDSNGDFWIGTWEDGIVKFNVRTGEGTKLEGVSPASVWHIHSIMQYSPGTLLVGSDSGLTLIDMTTGESMVYKNDELNHRSLSDRFVYPVMADSDGGLWIGTYYRGVNYLSPDSRRFRRWYHSRFVNSVSGNIVSRFSEDAQGMVWIGTADGGLCRFNPRTGAFTNIPLGHDKQNYNVNALCSDGNRLWVGTYSRGGGWLDINSGKWTPVAVDGNFTFSSYAINKDKEGRIWLASMANLAKYNPEKEMFETVGNFGAWITDIDENPDGRLWLSTQGNGLFLYDPKHNTSRHFEASNAAGALPHNHINCVTVDHTGAVYVGTIYGAYRYDSNTERFNKIYTGTKNISVLTMTSSGGDIWMSTLSGLMRLDKSGRPRLYTYSDGINDNEFIAGSSLEASDGNIYYGTVHGFCRLDPHQAIGCQAPPRLKFTGLDIVNESQEVGGAHLGKSLNEIDRLVLTAADHIVSIYFSALSYANPEGNFYLYKLEGFDKSWLTTGKENRATYSNLPPGKYTLRVKAANADGVWNEEGISLKIEVRPAWYASAWMKAIYVILGAAALLLAVRYILWRMERSHITELDRISANKEKEMYRSKLKFFTVVAHEIRTPVSLIIGPLEKILESSDKFSPDVKDDLNVINRNSQRLLALVNQLLDFKKVEDNALPVGFRHEKIAPLVENVADRFRPSLEHKGMTLTVDCADPELTVDVDPEAITKLVSNLLNNARKFTKSKIILTCSQLDATRCRITVEDDGIGIRKENLDKIFKPFFQVLDNVNEARGGTGLGLSIVKSVTDAHGGTVEVESSPGKGAKFIVTLPIHQEKVMPKEQPLVVAEPKRHHENAEPAVETQKPVLLIVDDNKEMVKFIAGNFEKHYDILTAFDGREALDMLRVKPVSLIICDWMMPVMDGVEFLKKVRNDENYSHIPFVMLTAKTDNLSKIETMKSGADIYIEKPFSMGYLEACIGNLLDMRGMLKKKFSESPLEPITTLASTQVDSELLGKLQTLIEENFSNSALNVDFLADHLGMSRSSLYAKIRTLTELTPNELIQVTRLKKAAILLKEGKYRINEICYMVGFNSSSYFSRCFQKQFGVKPGDFAQQKG